MPLKEAKIKRINKKGQDHQMVPPKTDTFTLRAEGFQFSVASVSPKNVPLSFLTVVMLKEVKREVSSQCRVVCMTGCLSRV